MSLHVRAAAAVLLLAVAACTPLHKNYGYVPFEEDLEELVVGVDTRADVEEVVGVPTTSGLLADGNYYYVRSRVRSYGVQRPKVIDREVVVISFDESGTLRNIERFGLDQGNVVRLTRRVTDSSVVTGTFLRQVFGNIGAVDPNQVFN